MTQVLQRPGHPRPGTPPAGGRHGRPRQKFDAVAWAVGLARLVGYWRAAAVVIAAGSALRVYHWVTAGSFSQDEVSLVINVAHRSFGGLRGGLEYDQMAPMGWLWVEKLAYTVAGPGEMSLRFVPLVFGCAALVPVAAVARRLMSAPAALLATALVAGVPQLLYYSTQAKQYSAEAACTALLLLLALRASPPRTGTRRVGALRVGTDGHRACGSGSGRVAAFWGVAGASVWFATTAMFAAAAVGGLLLLFAAWRGQWRRARWHAVGGVCAAVSLGLEYLVQRPHVASWLTTWWATRYPGSMGPDPLTPYAWLTWTLRCGNALASQVMGVPAHSHRLVIMALLVAGAVALLLRGGRAGVLVASPVAVAYVLGLARLYPFGARLALWVAPIMMIMVCAGFDAALRGVLRRPAPGDRIARRWVAGGLAVLAAVALGWVYAPTIGRYQRHSQLARYARAEEAIRWVAGQRGPDDRVYLGYVTERLAIWYGPRAGLRWDGTYRLVEGDACRGPAPDLAEPGTATTAALAAAPRVWLVLRATERDNPGRLAQFHAIMSRSAVLVREVRFNWIVVAEYRFAGAAVGSGPTAPPAPAPVTGARCFRFTPEGGPQARAVTDR